MSKQETLGTIAVEYIGRREQWIEKRHASGLTFTRGQVRNLPEDLAHRLLRHNDLFAIAKGDAGSGDDDTAEQLAKANAKAGKSKDEQRERQEILDQIMTMDKDALAEFAYTRYEQQINKRRSVDNLREEVLGYVDQFGVV